MRIFLVLAALWLAAPASAADLYDGLPGTAWNVVEWNGAPPQGLRKPNLQFGRDGTIAGWGGCNRFGGRYAAKDGRIAFAITGWTKIWCGAIATEIDGKFATDLGRVARLATAGNGAMAAHDSAGAVVFRLQRHTGAP